MAGGTVIPGHACRRHVGARQNRFAVVTTGTIAYRRRGLAESRTPPETHDQSQYQGKTSTKTSQEPDTTLVATM